MTVVYTPLGDELYPFDEVEEGEEEPSISPFEDAAVLLRFGAKRVPTAVWAHQPNQEL